jgi:glycosyltransferase involved in cell wall biosynthesis
MDRTVYPSNAGLDPEATDECVVSCDPSQTLPVNVTLFTNMIAPYFLPVLRNLAASLRSLQVFVSVAMEPNRPWKPNWDAVDVTVQRSFMLRRVVKYKQGFSMELFKHFPYDSLYRLYKCRPDVVISSQLGFRTMQAVIYRLLNPGSRLVIWADLSEHTEGHVGRGHTLMRQVFLRSADAVLVNGASGARYIRALGVPEERIVLAPYSTETSGFIAIPIQKEPSTARRLLYVGNLVEGKGLDLFLRTLALWAKTCPERKCEMWIVGDGPARKNLEHWPLPPNLSLSFFGGVPYHHVPDYYAQAGILVFPTLSDTWGLVVNEGMAAGLPVLGSSYSQAVQELVRDDFNGWTFRADQPSELANALERALSVPLATLAQMREAARNSVGHLTPRYGAGRFLQAVRVAMHRDK